MHSFDRIAVYNREFLTAEVAVSNRALGDRLLLISFLQDNPRTGRLHFIGSLLPSQEVRILPFALPSLLPTVCNNRVNLKKVLFPHSGF